MEKGALGLLVRSETLFPSSGVEALRMWAVRPVGTALPAPVLGRRAPSKKLARFLPVFPGGGTS